MKKLPGYDKKSIVIAHLQDVLAFPPVINLTEILLSHGHTVYFVGYNVNKMPIEILNDPDFIYTDIPLVCGKGIKKKFKRGIERIIIARKAVEGYMKKAEYLWTTTDLSCRSLGKILFKYRHIMQLMELNLWYPYIQGLKYPKFPIDEYGRRAWKMVEPEQNRAYIHKVIWKLPKTPYVLPNKNYKIDPGEIINEIKPALQKMKNEERKIIFYLGALVKDRNFLPFMDAIEKIKDEYCFYIAGPVSCDSKEYYQKLFKKYEATKYLGMFPAPKHLHLLKYAYIGLLPYQPGNSTRPYISELNALYCAPNKIFEYSGYGIPMIGTDVIALKQPFEKYDMGLCIKDFSSNEIIKAIKNIENRYDEMARKCKRYYQDINLDNLWEDILKD